MFEAEASICELEQAQSVGPQQAANHRLSLEPREKRRWQTARYPVAFRTGCNERSRQRSRNTSESTTSLTSLHRCTSEQAEDRQSEGHPPLPRASKRAGVLLEKHQNQAVLLYTQSAIEGNCAQQKTAPSRPLARDRRREANGRKLPSDNDGNIPQQTAEGTPGGDARGSPAT